MAIDFNQFCLSVSRMVSSFRDDIGNNSEFSGTGFWLFYNNKGILVTNRHMLDYQFYKEDSKMKLHELKIFLRTKTHNTITDLPLEFEINLSKSRIVSHESADVAIIIPEFLQNDIFTHSINVNSRLAEDVFFNELSYADSCVFIGYPSQKQSDPWWDMQTGLPIVRLANLASYPNEDFINKSVKCTHARLVAGLSFGGSSGSPILNIGTQVSAGTGISITGAVEPMIIGIMAGHWWDETSTPEMMKHTGLSYFVASTAIHDLLKSI